METQMAFKSASKTEIEASLPDGMLSAEELPTKGDWKTKRRVAKGRQRSMQAAKERQLP